MPKDKNSNFFQPIISVFGLGISLITAILPFFSKSTFTVIFINKEIIQPVSFIAFVLGIATIWQIIEQQFIQINLGSLRKRNNAYPEYWKTLNSSNLIWIFIIFDLIFGFTFLTMKGISNNFYLGFIQAFIYLLFFILLISIFALLFAQTKNKFDWEDKKDNLTTTIFQTLEKNGLVKPWIQILENRMANPDEINKHGLQPFFMVKRLIIKTKPQEEELLEFFMSQDGKEIYKVVNSESRK